MPDVTLLIIGKNLIVPIQSELDDLSARSLQNDILSKIEKTGAKGLLIDISAVSIIDSFMARLLVETARMAKLMGAASVLVGMKKEVVLTLIHIGMNMKGLHTSLNLEDGLALLEKLSGSDL